LHCYDCNGDKVSHAETALAYPRPTSKRSHQYASLAPDDKGYKKEMDHKDSICHQLSHAFHPIDVWGKFEFVLLGQLIPFISSNGASYNSFDFI
jgi:hypothetical protein